MDSSSYTRLNGLILGGNVLAASIAALANFSGVLQGDLAFDTTDNATPAVQLIVDGGYPQDALAFQEDGDVETGSGDVLANPYRNPEHCIGFSGSLLCQRRVVLSGSGGNRGHNAGSFVCTTATCSIISLQAHIEANPKNDKLYVGWTNSPATASGAQFVNNQSVASGAIILGSGSYINPTTKTTVSVGVVPANATVKAVWNTGITKGTQTGAVKGAIDVLYWKFYTP